MAQNQWWEKLKDLSVNQGSDDQLYGHCFHICKTIITFHLRMSLMIVKINNFIKSQPLCTYLFNMVGKEIEVHIKHLCCIPKYNGCQRKASEL